MKRALKPEDEVTCSLSHLLQLLVSAAECVPPGGARGSGCRHRHTHQIHSASK